MNRKLVVIIFCFLPLCIWGQRYVVINKAKFCLSVIENEDTLFHCSVGLGRNLGNKEKTGDMKTPEGTFAICSIEKSSSWKHDFKDGKGARLGAYGPYFFRLNVPKFKSIDIHGLANQKRLVQEIARGAFVCSILICKV